MENHGLADPALTTALALLVGLSAQVIAHHLRLPGIILLLAAGALMGPDGLGLIVPESVRDALPHFIGFAVAVILFEGGLNLKASRLRHSSGTIQRLITLGAGVTLIGAAVSAHFVLGWDWRLALLFGTLAVVTGPTVVAPLVRRIRLNKRLATILEGEGVLIDPVGAILAVVTLDIVLRPSLSSAFSGFIGIGVSLGTGALSGLVGGWSIAAMLRMRGSIPEQIENVFVLSAVLVLYQLSNVLQPESGLAAVTAAGIVVGNSRTPAHRQLAEFKEQLTLLFIGMLFVLLSADVRFDELFVLGTPGLLVVAILMLLVRPLGVILCTSGSGLSVRERLFLMWMAPRGIVAAAVASYFALRMQEAGVEGGLEVRAMVFLVIIVTVTLNGLTGGLIAHLLGVRLPRGQGWLILGAQPLGLVLGRALRDAGVSVCFLDSSADATRTAQDDGFKVVFGNAIEEKTLQRAAPEQFHGCIAATVNEEMNLIFARKVIEEYHVGQCYVATNNREGHITTEMVRRAEAKVLFGGERDLRRWETALARREAAMSVWAYRRRRATRADVAGLPGADATGVLLALVRIGRWGRARPIGDDTRIRRKDRVIFVIMESKRDIAHAWLQEHGWECVDEPAVTARGEQVESPAEAG